MVVVGSQMVHMLFLCQRNRIRFVSASQPRHHSQSLSLNETLSDLSLSLSPATILNLSLSLCTHSYKFQLPINQRHTQIESHFLSLYLCISPIVLMMMDVSSRCSEFTYLQDHFVTNFVFLQNRDIKKKVSNKSHMHNIHIYIYIYIYIYPNGGLNTNFVAKTTSPSSSSSSSSFFGQ